MLKAIKIRIYPNENQVAYINKQLGCCRYVYNQCLEFRKSSYEKDKTSVSATETIHHIVTLKINNEWLKEVNSKVLQQSVRDMNKAYKNFFDGKCRYPRFKSKHDSYQSCRFPKDAFSGIKGNRITLTTDLKNILFKCSRKDEKYLNRHQDKVSSITLFKDCTDAFHLSVLTDQPQGERPKTDKAVGIDLGIKDFVIASNGEVFENLHLKKREKNRLRRLQRQLSNKTVGSNNRNKARKRLAKLHKKITNRKLHYIHQVTNTLINENQVIGMEDLNVKGMVKNHKLAESVMEMNFGEFRRILKYKALWYGRQLVFVSRFYPSSKTCHYCGHIKKDLSLSDREWICPQCGKVIDRDYNASQNIRDEALRIIGLSSPEYTLADYPTMDDKLGDKALKSSDRMKQETNVFNELH